MEHIGRTNSNRPTGPLYMEEKEEEEEVADKEAIMGGEREEGKK